MKVSLLLCAGMLSLIPALPVAATPVLDAAQVCSQVTISTYNIHPSFPTKFVVALQEAISIASDAPENARKKPGRTTFANIVLERGVSEAVEASLTTDEAGNELCDAQLFAEVLVKHLSKNSAEMSHYAAIGWGLSEKRAASKIAALAKSPSFEGTHAAVIAILDGIIEEMSVDDYAGAEDALEAIQKGKEKWIEIQGWDWEVG